jgi:hypothetical protein
MTIQTTTIELNAELTNFAQEMGLNVSKTCENALKEAIRRLQGVIPENTSVRNAEIASSGIVLSEAFMPNGVTVNLGRSRVSEISPSKKRRIYGYQLLRTIIVLVFMMPSTRRIFSMHSFTSVTFSPLMTVTMSYSPVTS